ncbi:hypothetical protein AHAS_Ahas05G0101600 [Arachis hypogaea]
MITLTATAMCDMAAASGAAAGAPVLALKLSFTLLFSAATIMVVIMNKIQPSQLAEEQHNATRLFKQLEAEIDSEGKIVFQECLFGFVLKFLYHS